MTFSAYVAGYWEIAASCSATVFDLEGDMSWGGSADTEPQYVTSALVSFSSDPIVTGADKNKSGSIFTPVVATVAPADLTNKISVNTFIDSGTGSAGVENSQPNASAGTIAFNLYGINGTSKTMAQGDIELDAKDGSAVLGSAEVIVVIPSAIGTPHPTFNGTVTPANMGLDASSVPAWRGPLNPGQVELVTLAGTSLSVPVIDQFGNPLGGVYNGQTVYEGGKSINVKISAGHYSDYVGAYVTAADPPWINPCGAGSATEQKWLAAPTTTIPNSTQTQNVQVEIAGFTLNPGVVNRKVNYSNGELTVTWP